MAKQKDEKTNVMRVLERAKLDYRHYCYAGTGALSGGEVARALGQDPNRVFKTLVTVGKSGAHYVFLVPVLRELQKELLKCFLVAVSSVKFLL